jgi:hypothetical protein
MIGPKTPQPTAREENEAYELATLRDGNTCVRCRRGTDVTRDHRKGRGVGGKTVVENLQLLCGTGTTGCHGWKTTHPAEAIEDGYTVPGWADPAEYPGKRWMRTSNNVLIATWCLYNPDGTITSISDREAAERRAGRFA